MYYNNIHIKSKFYFKKGGKLDPDRFTIDGESILFTGNQTGSMDVKFNKVAKIASRYDKIVQDLNKIIQTNSGIPTNKNYNLAVATLLIIKTGIRIGNEDSAEGFMSDIKEKGKTVLAKTYGLTTLLPEHVKVENGIVKFDFTGKKHVRNTFELSKQLSQLVVPIIDSNHNPVFNITEPELTSFIKKETSPYLSSKDFRTFRANVYAYQKASKMPVPDTKKQWKEQIKEVHEHVSILLNNTPAVVKSSYVDQRLYDEMWGTVDQMEAKEKAAKEAERAKKQNKKTMGGKFKFQDGGITPDGKYYITESGNYISTGAITPADSPFEGFKSLGKYLGKSGLDFFNKLFKSGVKELPKHTAKNYVKKLEYTNNKGFKEMGKKAKASIEKLDSKKANLFNLYKKAKEDLTKMEDFERLNLLPKGSYQNQLNYLKTLESQLEQPKFKFQKGGITTYNVYGAAGENIDSCRKILSGKTKTVFPGSESVCRSQSEQHGNIKFKKK